MSRIAAVLAAWRKFDRAVLRRGVPHAVLSWRYLSPGRDPFARMHRRVFLRAWPRQPRWVWCLIAIYSYGVWYLYHAWRQALRAWIAHSAATAVEGTGRGRQLAELFLLAYGHAVPPAFYYRFGLWRVPESRWLGFVFTHELPHWHEVLSVGCGKRSPGLLQQKHRFAEEMGAIGLAVVETVAVIRKGAKAPAVLFSERVLFLKPVDGSRKQGCRILRYGPGYGYRLEGDDPGAESVVGEAAIAREVESLAKMRGYLVQPLLRNHADLEGCGAEDTLSTLRLVTVRGASGFRPLSAVLEIPVAPLGNRVLPLPISAEGRISARARSYAGLKVTRQLPEGYPIPLWTQAVEAALRAHAALPDMASIGWDLALTDRGPLLLEGNANWAVSPHQIHGAPLLPAWLELVTGLTPSVEGARGPCLVGFLW